MLDNTWFWTWNGINGCEGGRQVKEALGIRGILHQNSTFQGSRDKVVINWGSSRSRSRSWDQVCRCRIINTPEAVALSVNKLDFFQRQARRGTCRTVPWTSDRRVACQWALEGSRIVVREQLEGHEGAGIQIFTAPPRSNLGLLERTLPNARLYTKFIPSLREYRVHVVGGEAIAVHRKTAGTDETVRNTANGWMFRRVREYPRDVVTQALAAVRALGLDFAAVDVLWTSDTPNRCQLQPGAGLAYVLETNTAPGIDGMDWTIRQYAQALERLINALPNL